MSNIRKEIRESFAGLNSDEILEKLLDNGFNVKKGKGKIKIKEDKVDDEVSFQLQSSYTLETKVGSGKTEEFPIGYPIAS